MTNTEVLLILIGGIFVIEALSVLIQVFSFQIFRKRVFLMAPIHHHFELQALVGDEDHAALLDRRRGLRRDRLHVYQLQHPRLTAQVGPRRREAAAAAAAGPVPGRRPRPLGRGRRAGAARPRGGGDRVRCGRDRDRRRSTRWREGFRAAGVEVHLDASGDALAARAGTLIKSPGVPQNAPVVRRGASRAASPVHRRARARLAAAPERVHRGDRHQRQDDDDRVDRPHPPRGRRAGRGRRQRRHGASSSLVGDARAGCDRRLRGLLVPARGHRSRSRPRSRAAQPRARPPRPPRQLRRLRGGEAADLRQPGQRRHRGRADDLEVEDLGGCARPRAVRLEAPAAERLGARRRRSVVGRASRCSRSSELALPGEHNRQNAMAAAAACLARGLDPDAVAPGCAPSPASPHRLELVATIDGVALRQRLQGDERRQHARRAALRSRAAST